MKLPEEFIMIATEEICKQRERANYCREYRDHIARKIARGEHVPAYEYQKGCDMITEYCTIETYLQNISRFLKIYGYKVSITNNGECTIVYYK